MENFVFDYHSFGESYDIPIKIIHEFEEETRNEFPFDKMLMEIHVLRAIKSYVKVNNLLVSIEN